MIWPASGHWWRAPALQRDAPTPWRVVSRTAILISLSGLGGCGEGVLSPAGPVGDAERIILLDSLAIMLAIIIPTVLATLAFAWWFRASNTRALHLPEWSYSGRLELVVWSIPALVVMFLGGIAWISSHDLDPARPLSSPVKPLEVDVVSLDWEWLFIYPQQGVASINHLTVPVGVPLHFRITSATVMNVFFVPRLGSMIYAMNGMATQLNLQADKPGTYHGLSGQFSGDGFSNMVFDVQAVSQSQFDDWIAQTHGSGRVLDEAAYRGLLRQKLRATPYTYSVVKAGLFDAIVTQALPSGDGPVAASTTPRTSSRAGE